MFRISSPVPCRTMPLPGWTSNLSTSLADNWRWKVAFETTHTPGLTRRRLLQVGGIGMLGLGLPDLLAAGSVRRRPEKSCIFIVQYGGCSHIDSLDPKPD